MQDILTAFTELSKEAIAGLQQLIEISFKN